jgi:hypothetical protein
MKTFFTAEALPNGGYSGTIQTPGRLLPDTAGKPLEKGGMNKANGPVDRARIGLGIVLLAALTGCVGYVDGGYYGGPVVVPGPDVYFYGGGYERGHDVRVYSHRGIESRAVAHPARSAPARSPGGGHEGKR